MSRHLSLISLAEHLSGWTRLSTVYLGDERKQAVTVSEIQVVYVSSSCMEGISPGWLDCTHCIDLDHQPMLWWPTELTTAHLWAYFSYLLIILWLLKSRHWYIPKSCWGEGDWEGSGTTPRLNKARVCCTCAKMPLSGLHLSTSMTKRSYGIKSPNTVHRDIAASKYTAARSVLSLEERRLWWDGMKNPP